MRMRESFYTLKAGPEAAISIVSIIRFIIDLVTSDDQYRSNTFILIDGYTMASSCVSADRTITLD